LRQRLFCGPVLEFPITVYNKVVSALSNTPSRDRPCHYNCRPANPETEVILIESGGDNLSATFSPELVDAFIYVIDVAEGDKIPRKGGPAIQYSDLIIINKTELAPHVGADLDVMDRDSKKMRGPRPFLFCDLKSSKGLSDVCDWLKKEALFH